MVRRLACSVAPASAAASFITASIPIPKRPTRAATAIARRKSASHALFANQVSTGVPLYPILPVAELANPGVAGRRFGGRSLAWRRGVARRARGGGADLLRHRE